MHRYFPVRGLRICGAPVYVHWMVIVVAVALLAYSIKAPIAALATLASYFGILLLHESGHAWFARRLGCRPHSIHVGLFHGRCTYDTPAHDWTRSVVAWGGVLAQFAVAIPLILLDQLTGAGHLPVLGPMIAYLGYLSTFVAVVNLAPAPGLDGAQAWRVFRLRRGPPGPSTEVHQPPVKPIRSHLRRVK